MSTYFGQRTLTRSPLQEKLLPLVGLTMVALLAAAALILLLQDAPARTPVVKQAGDQVGPTFVDVLVPLHDIEENTSLEPSMFRRVARPIDTVSPAIVRDFEAIQNQFAKAFIVGGEPLHSAYLVRQRSALEGPIRNRIPRGFRAVTIRVDDTTAVDGLVRPGEIVDVSRVHRVNGQLAVSILVQNAKVLVADKQVDPNWKPGMPIPGTITLLVSAEDYKNVELGKASGKLGLALRGADGAGVGDGGSTVTEADLPGLRPLAPPSQTPLCQGKVKTCSSVGHCEEFCMKADGSLSPLGDQLRG
ncbi:MAG: Flp pilus assembly protein CpaB [Deltaproteobacteria bacterium]|nr:Flp pilus assembly protein CpaB [Deltaproteobacteria bacterium]